MRQTKFRVWDEKYNQWDASPVLFYPNQNISLQGRVIQWFTGLKDKDGREIYEGDIVNFVIPGVVHGPEKEEYKNQAVKWDEECACWCFDSGFNYNHSIVGDRIDVKSLEIVGNIFENPELLCAK